MMMRCESLLSVTIPAIKASIAKELYKQGMSQQQIAKLLDVAQPAVSKYLNGNYSSRLKKVERVIKSKKLNKYAVKVALVSSSAKNVDKEIEKIALDKDLIAAASK